MYLLWQNRPSAIRLQKKKLNVTTVKTKDIWKLSTFKRRPKATPKTSCIHCRWAYPDVEYIKDNLIVKKKNKTNYNDTITNKRYDEIK